MNRVLSQTSACQNVLVFWDFWGGGPQSFLGIREKLYTDARHPLSLCLTDGRIEVDNPPVRGGVQVPNLLYTA
jgi:hypothetical protein